MSRRTQERRRQAEGEAEILERTVLEAAGAAIGVALGAIVRALGGDEDTLIAVLGGDHERTEGAADTRGDSTPANGQPQDEPNTAGDGSERPAGEAERHGADVGSR